METGIQDLAAIGLVAVALLYLGRSALSLFAARSASGGCGTGCGSCASGQGRSEGGSPGVGPGPIVSLGPPPRRPRA